MFIGRISRELYFGLHWLALLVIAPYQIVSELRAQIAEFERRTLNREQRASIANLLQERYEGGVAIRDRNEQENRVGRIFEARR